MNKKRSYRTVDFIVPDDHGKTEGKRDKFFDLAREWEKTMEHESEGDTNCNRRTRYSHLKIGTGTG